MLRLLLLLAGLPLPVCAQALKDSPVVTIVTRDFKVEFAGNRAWTIYRILHQGELITDKKGFHGTVFSPEGGRWIGTGHDEGGTEKVEQVSLIVDGKACDLNDQAVYQGHRATLEKRSTLGPLKLQATYVVTDDAILERHRYEAMEDMTIGTLYAFMHPWVPGTTEWMAELTDHTLAGGKFDSGGGYQMSADPKWTAVYNPVSHRIALAWFPRPLAGQGLKSTYRDKKIYHKLYNQICSHARVTKGLKFEAEVVVRSAESAGPDWQETAKALAKETAESFAGGKLGF